MKNLVLGIVCGALALLPGFLAPLPASAQPSSICPREGRPFARAFQVAEGASIAVAGVAGDAQGNALVAGGFAGTLQTAGARVVSAGGTDGFVARLDPCGSPLWMRPLGGAGDEKIQGVASDAAGNGYVLGQFSGRIDLGTGILDAQGSEALFVLALAPSGRPIWSRVLRAVDGDILVGKALTTDAQGRLRVLVDLEGTAALEGKTFHAGGLRAMLLGLDRDGLLAWATATTRRTDEDAKAIAADRAGNIVVAGEDARGSGIFASRVAPDGELRWYKRFRSTGSQVDELYGMSLAPDGQIVLSGSGVLAEGIVSPGAEEHAFLARLDPADGHVLWRRDVDWSQGNVVVLPDGRLVLGVPEQTHDSSTQTLLITLGPDGGVASVRNLGRGTAISSMATSSGAFALLAGPLAGSLDPGNGPLASGGLPAVFVAKVRP
jgi:outer membrane protein assembly factor BamB